MPNVDIDIAMLAPMAAVVCGSLVVLILDLLLPLGRSRPWVFAASAGAVAAAFVSVYQQWTALAGAPIAGWSQGLTTVVGAYVGDRFALISQTLILIAAGFAVLLSLSWREMDEEPELRDDNSGYLSLMLLASAGMMVMAGAGNLLTMFVGLELLSLSLYILVAFSRRQRSAKEAALKYFVLGSLAAGFLIYGFALIYGEAGSLALADIAAYWRASEAGSLMLLGIGLSFIGFSFKLALVPFHAWAPDVYQGAPTPVTAFMAAGTKVAAFAGLYRFVVAVVPQDRFDAIVLPLAVLAVMSMLVGSLGAVVQRDLKRLLAYSAIAHAGYLVLALANPTDAGVQSGLFYLAGYVFTIVGAFAVVLWIGGGTWQGTSLASLSGLYYRRPWPALALTAFLLSSTGVPPTAGFVGKWLLVMSGLEGGSWLLITGLIVTTGISAYAYLRVVRTMFARDAVAETGAGEGTQSYWRAAVAGDGPGAQLAPGERVLPQGAAPAPVTLAAVIALCVVGILQLGLAPHWLLTPTQHLLPLP